ncbi:MAG: NAD-dependent dehydratase, partial [Longimicrobiales bacterium]
CRAFLAVLHAPRELVHNQAFNVGRTRENYRVSELAEIVCQAVPGSRIRFAAGGGPDPRSYSVDCSKLENTLTEYTPRWTVPLGVQELADAFAQEQLTPGDFNGYRYMRIRNVQRLQLEGRLNPDLRWHADVSALQAVGD